MSQVLRPSMNLEDFAAGGNIFQSGPIRIVDAYYMVHQNPPPKDPKQDQKQEEPATKLMVKYQRLTKDGKPDTDFPEPMEENYKVGEIGQFLPSDEAGTSAGNILGSKGHYLLALDMNKQQVGLNTKFKFFWEDLKKSGFDITKMADTNAQVLVGTEGEAKRRDTLGKGVPYNASIISFTKIIKAGYETGTKAPSLTSTGTPANTPAVAPVGAAGGSAASSDANADLDGLATSRLLAALVAQGKLGKTELTLAQLKTAVFLLTMQAGTENSLANELRAPVADRMTDGAFVGSILEMVQPEGFTAGFDPSSNKVLLSK